MDIPEKLTTYSTQEKDKQIKTQHIMGWKQAQYLNNTNK